MTESLPLYRGLDAVQLDREYNPSSMIGGNYQPYIDRYISQSELARERLPHSLAIKLGVESTATLDLYYSGRNSGPLHFFIHGGYWQELSARDSAVMAVSLANRGISLAVMDYGLAPDTSIEQMITQCCLGLRYLFNNAAKLNIDPSSFSISGHSAGAQLAIMMLDQLREQELLSAIQLIVLISGIYDLEPLCYTSVNQAIGLSPAKARALSPQHSAVIKLPDTVIAVAQDDTSEFRRQAMEYNNKLRRAGVNSTLKKIDGLNHFDIVLSLESKGRDLLKRILACHDITWG